MAGHPYLGRVIRSVRHTRRSVVVGVVLVVLALLGSACQSSGSDAPKPNPNGGGTTAPGGVTGTSAGPGATTAPSPLPSPSPVSEARIRINPGDGKKFATPDQGLGVKVTKGTITDVNVETDGLEVTGEMGEDDTTWHSDWALETSKHYMVTVTAVDADGLSTTATSDFRTLTPKDSFRTIIFQGYKKTYGVGMPIILQFDRDIVNREEVERALELRTSKPVVGAWYWNGDSTLMFRPRGYWPAHTVVHFTGHLDGVKGAPGMFGVHTLTQDFNIGRSLIVVASTKTHHLQVYLDKKKMGDWLISTGKPGHETPNGTYLSITKHNPEEMIGEDYDIFVPFSVRFTWSGSFLHAASWSVNQQGAVNVSHGCVNMAPDNAEQYYKLSLPGDPVTIEGSPKPGEWDDGWTVWFKTWKQILEGTATQQAMRAGPNGSTFVDPGELVPLDYGTPLGTSKPGNYLRSPQ